MDGRQVRRVKRKIALDLMGAAEIGMNRAQFARATAAFIYAIREALARYGEVRIEGLGNFKVFVERSPVPMLERGAKKRPRPSGKRLLAAVPKIKVHFSKSRLLRRRLAKGAHHGEVRSR
jgi:nucleoid DNA-binding protein